MSDQRRRIPDVSIEDARIIFRNFAGSPTRFNPEGGKRTFSVILPDEIAQDMINDGWNVKEIPPRDPDDEPGHRLEVTVSFPRNAQIPPPAVNLITSRGRTLLGSWDDRKQEWDLSDLKMLDWAEIEKVDLKIRARNWDVNGNSGVKAYLKAIYVTIREDELEQKYANMNPILSDDEASEFNEFGD